MSDTIPSYPDTPRTNAREFHSGSMGAQYCVTSSFARQLERENADLRKAMTRGEGLSERPARLARLGEHIRVYLGNGGLFNPEHMEHQKVRDLLMEILRAIEGEPPSVNTIFK